MKTTSTYGAELIDVMGSDLTVVNAARVSFDKQSDWEDAKEDLGDGRWSDVQQLKDADAKLIAYLARNGHWTPFAHPQLSFRVSAPLFVARQLQKHQVGLAWNEVSRRYVDSDPTIYVPNDWRKRPDASIKQGSSDEIVQDFETASYGEFATLHMMIDDTSPASLRYGVIPVDTEILMLYACHTYERMVAAGVCPEQARMVLPQSMITEWVWTGSLAAFARVCKQRLDPHAQRECKPVAEAIAKALREHFPVSYMALTA